MNRFKTSELREIIEAHIRHRPMTEVFGYNSSAYRGAYEVLHSRTGYTQLSRADLICTALGHPEYLQSMTEV